MGSEYIKRPVFDKTGYKQPVQVIAASTDNNVLTPGGVTFITSTSTGNDSFTLGEPQVGLEKVIVVDVNTTDAVDVFTHSTATVFWGTTGNALRFSTGAVTPKRAELIGRSTAAWAVRSLSTGVTVVAATQA